MRRKYNLEILVQILILLGLAGILLYGMLSGKVNYYIHPRYHVGIWISIAALFLFTFRLTAGIKKARHNVNLKPYLLFIIPLITVFLFPPSEVTNAEIVIAGSMTGRISENGNTQITQITNSDEFNDSSNNSYEGADIYEEAKALDEAEADDGTDSADSSDLYYPSGENNITDIGDINGNGASDTTENYQENIEPENIEPVYTEPEDKSEKYMGNTKNGAIIIEDDYFTSWYYDLYDYLDDFVGERYQFLAQVYSMEDLKDNQFLAGRYVMVCCAADVAAYGLICESDIRSELVDEQWITVTATIGAGEYEGTKVPVLTDVIISKAEAPKDAYVYYNFY